MRSNSFIKKKSLFLYGVFLALFYFNFHSLKTGDKQFIENLSKHPQNLLLSTLKWRHISVDSLFKGVFVFWLKEWTLCWKKKKRVFICFTVVWRARQKYEYISDLVACKSSICPYFSVNNVIFPCILSYYLVWSIYHGNDVDHLREWESRCKKQRNHVAQIQLTKRQSSTVLNGQLNPQCVIERREKKVK